MNWTKPIRPVRTINETHPLSRLMLHSLLLDQPGMFFDDGSAIPWGAGGAFGSYTGTLVAPGVRAATRGGIGLFHPATAAINTGVRLTPVPATASFLPAGTIPWSVDFLINPVSLGDGYQTILTVGGATGFYVRSTGAWDIYQSGDHNSAAGLVVTGVWQHFLLSFDGVTTVTIYNNGASVGTITFTGFSLAFQPTVMLNDGISETFAGYIEFCRSWGRALTPAEAKWLYREPYAMYMQSVQPVLKASVGTVDSLLAWLPRLPDDYTVDRVIGY